MLPYGNFPCLKNNSILQDMLPVNRLVRDVSQECKALTKRRKRGRPRAENPMVHTAVVLPRDLLDQLRTAAELTGRGLSTEIRERLQDSADLDKRLQIDVVMSDLLNSIRLLAERLSSDMGKEWHRDPDVLEAFEAGVVAFLGQYPVQADESAGPTEQLAGELDDPPDVVGRTLARRIWTEKHEGKLPVDVKVLPWKKPRLANGRKD